MKNQNILSGTGGLVLLTILTGLCLTALSFQNVARAANLTEEGFASDSRFFPETGQTVSGKFLDYWNNNGGLAVFGYPITDAENETDSENGKVYLTQWFE